MRFWLTSDTHFGHRKMEEYCGRPKDFEARILRSHAAIPRSHILIHLGDVCIGNDAAMHATWVNKIPCRKWLIMGNHDRKSRDWYLKHGWEFVTDAPLPYRIKNEWVWLSHQPMPLSTLSGQRNIHGHCHNKGYRETPNDWQHKLISLEAVNYAPQLIEKL